MPGSPAAAEHRPLRCCPLRCRPIARPVPVMSRSSVHLPALSAALLLLLSSIALAHATERGDSLWRAWSLDPWVSIPLAVAGLLHVIGLWRLARRGRGGKRARWRDALLF